MSLMVCVSLNPQILHAAYSQGYFPMADHAGEVLWYRPDPRAIIPLDGFKASRSLQRLIRRDVFRITYNRAFREVMGGCADRPETWISDDFVAAYAQLHAMGAAQSVEVWLGDYLAGGVYGVNFGGAFFAESMFHSFTGASKVALWALVEKLRQRGFTLLECQFLTDHLASLGAVEISDQEYMERLTHALQQDVYFDR